jgi:hypothetical protein
MQDEINFYVVDRATVYMAVLALAVAYPGVWYKPVLGAGEDAGE